MSVTPGVLLSEARVHRAQCHRAALGVVEPVVQPGPGAGPILGAPLPRPLRGGAGDMAT